KLLGQKRKQIPSLKADVQTQVRVLDNPSIVYFVRKHSAGTFVGLFNMSPNRHEVHLGSLKYLGINNPFDVLTDLPLSTSGETITVEPYGALWLVNND
ncbi:MAG: Amylosucrase, partial [Actinomycetota bacterium]